MRPHTEPHQFITYQTWHIPSHNDNDNDNEVAFSDIYFATAIKVNLCFIFLCIFHLPLQ